MTDLRAIDEAAWLARQKPGRWETAVQIVIGIVAAVWLAVSVLS